MPDHVHMLISIPPKYSVAQIIGYMKGKSSMVIRAYIKNQELADQQLEQFELKISAAHNPNNRPKIP